MNRSGYIGTERRLRRLLAEGKTLEKALVELREAGASILECIAAVRRVRGYDLAEARRRVQFSEAWADAREGTEKLWETLEEEPDTSAEDRRE